MPVSASASHPAVQIALRLGYLRDEDAEGLTRALLHTGAASLPRILDVFAEEGLVEPAHEAPLRAALDAALGSCETCLAQIDWLDPALRARPVCPRCGVAVTAPALPDPATLRCPSPPAGAAPAVAVTAEPRQTPPPSPGVAGVGDDRGAVQSPVAPQQDIIDSSGPAASPPAAVDSTAVDAGEPDSTVRLTPEPAPSQAEPDTAAAASGEPDRDDAIERPPPGWADRESVTRPAPEAAAFDEPSPAEALPAGPSPAESPRIAPRADGGPPPVGRGPRPPRPRGGEMPPRETPAAAAAAGAPPAPRRGAPPPARRRAGGPPPVRGGGPPPRRAAPAPPPAPAEAIPPRPANRPGMGPPPANSSRRPVARPPSPQARPASPPPPPGPSLGDGTGDGNDEGDDPAMSVGPRPSAPIDSGAPAAGGTRRMPWRTVTWVLLAWTLLLVVAAVIAVQLSPRAAAAWRELFGA